MGSDTPCSSYNVHTCKPGGEFDVVFLAQYIGYISMGLCGHRQCVPGMYYVRASVRKVTTTVLIVKASTRERVKNVFPTVIRACPHVALVLTTEVALSLGLLNITCLVRLDMLDQRRLAAVVETNHEDTHVSTKTAHS